MKGALIYVGKRILLMLVVLFTVITITFTLLELKPGDPLDGMVIRTEAQREQLIHKYNLDKSALQRYGIFWKGLITEGSLGYSVKKEKEINQIIAEAVPISASIGIGPVIFGSSIGVMLGILAALYKNSIIDYGTTFLVVLGVSIPNFVVASILQYWLAGEWGIFPSMYGSSSYSMITWYVLPFIALSFGVFATYSRFARTEMVEALYSDYIMLAKAKGSSQKRVIFGHALRNILIPVVTMLPFTFMIVIVGSLAVEQVFSIPGMGGLLVKAIQANDYNLVLGINFFITVIVLLCFLAVDILIVIVDPRIRIRGGK